MFELSGNLTMREVPAIWQQSQIVGKSSRIPERIDLSALERTDSSALALLLEWQSRAIDRGQRIEFANPPESLRVLAGLSQAGELLGWHDQAQTREPSPEQEE